MRSTKIAPLSLSTSYLTGSASLGISMTTLISSGTLLPVGTWSRPMGWRFLRRGRARPGTAAGVVGRGWQADFTPLAAALQHRPTSGTPQLGRLHTGAYTYGHVSTSRPINHDPARHRTIQYRRPAVQCLEPAAGAGGGVRSVRAWAERGLHHPPGRRRR